MIATLLPLLLLLPLGGALANAIVAIRTSGPDGAGSRRHPVPTWVGPGVLLAAFGVALALFGRLRIGGTEPVVVSLGSWMPVAGLSLDWSLQLDALSMLMVLVITGVGSLIHVYSVGYMREDPGYARYFAYLNLFVAFMLLLVLGASYPVLFVGWEGVGLASYLLIGFWYRDVANAEAGRTAFLVNRIGDAAFLVAMFLLWTTTRHLDFLGTHAAVPALAGTGTMFLIACCLFIGCAGKSAQLPLYLWLPDAMAGPTPVSALIHAATMVTAGVYLVARAAPVFAAAPDASLLVASVGALTALFAATIALRQWDIKKVLAYSTVSQLGYMFIGVGSGAYVAGVFHLVTHAFFKALLFLGAGSVIHAMHHAYHHTHRNEDPQDLRNMGGLAHRMPLTATAMGVAALAIAGLPPFAGFFSKDAILGAAFAAGAGSALARANLFGIPGGTVMRVVYGLGMLTALLTAVYMTRLMMLAFFGRNRTGAAEADAVHEAPWVMTAPVLILGLLSLGGGWLNLPALLPWGPTGLLDRWLAPVVGESAHRLSGASHLTHAVEWQLLGVAVAVAIGGVAIGAYLHRRPMADAATSGPDTSLLARAFGIDRLVRRGIVRPLAFFADRIMGRVVDRGIRSGFLMGGSLLVRLASSLGGRLQNGDVGTYAALLTAGALALLVAMVTG
jgi:NADH-quinone oxidoreductase subunit L